MKKIIISFMFFYSMLLNTQPPPKIGDIKQCSDELIKEILKLAIDNIQKLHENILNPGFGILRPDEELNSLLKEKLR